MKIIRPFDITPSTLVSNIPQNDHPEYNSATTYNQGDLVIVSGNTNKIYEALKTTTNEFPPDNASTPSRRLTDPSWLDLGATNRWRMFDGKTSTFTTSTTGEIVVEVTANTVVNSIALFGLQAISVKVEVVDNSSVVYEKEITLVDNANTFNWFTYWFEESRTKEDIVLLDLPNYADAVTRITITGTNPQVAQCVIGTQLELGLTDYGTDLGIRDFSFKDTDAFGNFVVRPSRFSKRVNYMVTLNQGDRAFVQRTLGRFRITPLVWVGDDEDESLIVFGFYRDFKIILPHYGFDVCNISVEGL